MDKKLIQCPFIDKKCDAVNCLTCEYYPEELKFLEITEPFFKEEK